LDSSEEFRLDGVVNGIGYLLAKLTSRLMKAKKDQQVEERPFKAGTFPVLRHFS
jgi:hypothetical protein